MFQTLPFSYNDSFPVALVLNIGFAHSIALFTLQSPRVTIPLCFHLQSTFLQERSVLSLLPLLPLMPQLSGVRLPRHHGSTEATTPNGNLKGHLAWLRLLHASSLGVWDLLIRVTAFSPNPSPLLSFIRVHFHGKISSHSSN